VTIGELCTRIRRLIGDEPATHRVADTELFDHIYDGLTALWSTHPEAFYLDDIILDPPELPTATTDESGIDPIYAQAVAFFAAHRYFLQDSEAAGNAASADRFYQLYLKEI